MFLTEFFLQFRLDKPISMSSLIWWSIANLHALDPIDFKFLCPHVPDELYAAVQKKLDKNKSAYEKFIQREAPPKQAAASKQKKKSA